jgi:protein-S-isoprenylcysteine O-methyltransferase Ste14
VQPYLAVLTLVLLPALVLTRIFLLKRQGISAMHFGRLDKTDYLIPPFAVLYFYLVIAHAFHLPSPGDQEFFHSDTIAWAGVFFCLAGLVLFFLSLLSFGRSFRVGIDTQQPGTLVTTGVFSYSRNPIYVAFAFVLIGQFLIYPNWILLIYLAGAIWLFHRQVLHEEASLKSTYGKGYEDYCQRVRRYL